jgi:hypothetical protein
MQEIKSMGSRAYNVRRALLFYAVINRSLCDAVTSQALVNEDGRVHGEGAGVAGRERDVQHQSLILGYICKKHASMGFIIMRSKRTRKKSRVIVESGQGWMARDAYDNDGDDEDNHEAK